MQARQLEAFQQIVELGSFTRAAIALNISQPAVSNMMRLLAQDCGFPLFSKMGNQTLPTAEAMMLYSEVQRAIIGTQAVLERARAIRSLNSGRLEIFAFPGLATRVMPAIISEFLRHHEGITCTLTGRDAATFGDHKVSHDMDLGFSAVGGDRIGMTVDPFIEMELLCALPRGHRLAARSEITPKLLSNEPFIFLRYDPHVERKIEDAFTRAKCAPKIVAEVGLSEAACAFVSNGLGISLVDPFGVIAHSSTKLEIRRFQPRIVVDTWLFRPTYRPRSLLSNAFLDFAITRLPEVVDAVVPGKNILRARLHSPSTRR